MANRVKNKKQWSKLSWNKLGCTLCYFWLIFKEANKKKKTIKEKTWVCARVCESDGVCEWTDWSMEGTCTGDFWLLQKNSAKKKNWKVWTFKKLKACKNYKVTRLTKFAKTYNNDIEIGSSRFYFLQTDVDF